MPMLYPLLAQARFSPTPPAPVCWKPYLFTYHWAFDATLADQVKGGDAVHTTIDVVALEDLVFVGLRQGCLNECWLGADLCWPKRPLHACTQDGARKEHATHDHCDPQPASTTLPRVSGMKQRLVIVRGDNSSGAACCHRACARPLDVCAVALSCVKMRAAA
eukprot:CAMPEP_0168392210 /NCGR_PEP_ID=MMETSP0228-20121227/18382_1 /TAXON_ID=133427 /ORGANISM="Protoceratium reticulatum, Strain CCCM 535 (=CCMP 1889)" /LENGTH=161 /DNA_ID=CAMNT_0008405547 /DNA_START=586 /DNA_END=1070 /DNA_ORIENTATION=-